MTMNRNEFAERVQAARREHPTWFDLDPDAPLAPGHRTVLEDKLGARLPEDYVWFLETYGGADFAFARVYSGDPESDLYVVVNQDDRVSPHAIAFSDNGVGDKYAFPNVDGSCQDEVAFFDHETESFQTLEPEGFLSFVLAQALPSE